MGRLRKNGDRYIGHAYYRRRVLPVADVERLLGETPDTILVDYVWTEGLVRLTTDDFTEDEEGYWWPRKASALLSEEAAEALGLTVL